MKRLASDISSQNAPSRTEPISGASFFTPPAQVERVEADLADERTQLEEAVNATAKAEDKVPPVELAAVPCAAVSRSCVC